MGTVVVFAEARRAPHQNPPQAQAGPATVVILPVIRIEREGPRSPGENSNPPSPRKRRRRATPT
jgi:hypothetical protein